MIVSFRTIICTVHYRFYLDFRVAKIIHQNSKIINKKSVVNERQLPQGVILTGGEKLNQDGLTGKGVIVAVIDSGVDQNHPGFQGQVKKQVWLRSGTPLEVDDHGTHVAGTIHLMAPGKPLF